MDHGAVAHHGNDNASVWRNLARAGQGVYRDDLNTAAFWRSWREASGLSRLDIGCREGHNTRLLTKQGACVRAIDLSELFARDAERTERRKPLGND
jgi:2-polyprenyl-3-methyl-5-hydroxy-6-metoxy-1,4-benzoquinol methylase